MVSATPSVLRAQPAPHRTRLMCFAHEIDIPQGTHLFEEGGRADRFWIVRSGTVALDLHVPGRRSPVVESLGHDDPGHGRRSTATAVPDHSAQWA